LFHWLDCRAKARHPVTTALGENMNINESWTLIHNFLERDFPHIISTLSPGAHLDEIEKLEKHLMLELPADLKESLMIHNGQIGELGLFDFKNLFSCSEILSQFNMCTEIYNDSGPAHPSERPTTDRIATDVGWGKGWVPFAGFHLQGSSVVLLSQIVCRSRNFILGKFLKLIINARLK
jgi:cell wall assembly regulator SMI1